MTTPDSAQWDDEMAAPSHAVEFRLPAHASSVAVARRRLRLWLGTRECDDGVLDMAVLVMSELFTNAITHTDSTEITCVLRADEDSVRVEVRDQGCKPGQPRVRQAAADEESGRGLLIVSSVTNRWGVARDEHGTGRTIWAALPTAAV
ncbi:ATP-binding protein [Streptacidiphilus sp. MAP12-16]|uniref:ATP-binding protein n=1 Tax=Streptacidiphilus sp. MAP12-16 TaxID=3156300 RepID=UPI0035152C5A